MIEFPHHEPSDEVFASMRPAHAYANVSDEQYHQLVDALHRQWRVATRAVMVLLSAGGMSPAEIACILHYYDPATVRRWIRNLLTTPKAWTTAWVWQGLGRPAMGLHTVYRRIREQARWCRPRLSAKVIPTTTPSVPASVNASTRYRPGSVVLAEDETHLDLLGFIYQE